MAKRKAVQDAEVAGKTVEKGLLIVNTGPGKGKSTAAFGLALRMLGMAARVGVVQFVKGAWHTGEKDALRRVWRQGALVHDGRGFYLGNAGLRATSPLRKPPGRRPSSF
jgi:cob(I)alamin adenosyltransferase